jgi:metal-responsive CopG/Arc/MetJ family transcriptional regulator
MKYKKIKPQALLRLRDMHTALQYGSVKSDKRIQVVMPAEVINALDEISPETDRSKLLTKLAIEYILKQQYFSDRPEIATIAQDEQTGLDHMLTYLEERELSS